MEFVRKKPMKTVGFRLPDDVREKAQSQAQDSGVTESDVYRSIIVDFFSLNRNHIVHVKVDRKVKMS